MAHINFVTLLDHRSNRFRESTSIHVSRWNDDLGHVWHRNTGTHRLRGKCTMNNPPLKVHTCETHCRPDRPPKDVQPRLSGAVQTFALEREDWLSYLRRWNGSTSSLSLRSETLVTKAMWGVGLSSMSKSCAISSLYCGHPSKDFSLPWDREPSISPRTFISVNIVTLYRKQVLNISFLKCSLWRLPSLWVCTLSSSIGVRACKPHPQSKVLFTKKIDFSCHSPTVKWIRHLSSSFLLTLQDFQAWSSSPGGWKWLGSVDIERHTLHHNHSIRLPSHTSQTKYLSYHHSHDTKPHHPSQRTLPYP